MADSSGGPLASRTTTYRAIASAACGSAAMCASFAAVGSAILLVAWAASGSDAAPVSLTTLALKTVIMLGALAVAIAMWRKFCTKPATELEDPQQYKPNYPLVIIIAIATSAVLLPNLTKAPTAEPDELHHLIVARNIADHGVYGSGHPDSEFIHFDQYDSVGAPVLLPVAAAFQLFGIGFAPARVVMVLFFVALVSVVHVSIARSFGAVAGFIAAIMFNCAPMSIYLARTLYGEAPGLLFYILGAAYWGHGISTGKWPWHLAAGFALGLAILSKTYFVLGAWPFAAVLLHDRFTAKQARWSAAVLPVAGVAIVFGSWTFYESLHAHDVGHSAASTLFEYQHFLMFGIDPLPRTAAWWWNHPGFTIAAIIGYGYAAAYLFRRHSDHAMKVIFFFGILVIFWWMFYATGRTPRYLWYACAIGAMFSGITLARALTTWRSVPARAAFAAVVLLPAFAAFAHEFKQMHLTDQMEHERVLAEWMRELPEDARIATSFWPLTRLENFAAHRAVSLARDGSPWDVLVWKDGVHNEVPRPENLEAIPISGPYVAFRVNNP